MSESPEGSIVAGRYRLELRLRQGPVASLYAGTDLETGERIAARIFDAAPVAELDAAELSARAAPLLALDSPHLAPLHAVDFTADGWPVLIEGAIAGESLPDRLARQPLGLRESLQVLEGLLLALEACHHHQIIHRDVRPENVFLTGAGDRLSVQLRGAGSAGLFSERATPTLGGVAYGNPLYTAPEQWVNRAVGPSTDLYAVAALGYLLLTGRPLIPPGLPFEVCRAHFTALRPALEWTVAGEPVPAAVAVALQRAASAERQARFTTAVELRAALAAAEGALSLDAPVRLEMGGVEVGDHSFNLEVSLLEELPLEAGLSEHLIDDLTCDLPLSALGLSDSFESVAEPAVTVEMSLAQANAWARGADEAQAPSVSGALTVELPQMSGEELAEIEAMPDDTLEEG